MSWDSHMTTDSARFWARVAVVPNGCWRWTGSVNGSYGTFYFHGRTAYAHRVSYEMFVGPIPEGLTIDHLCRYPLCVNPSHLEPVPMRENTLRGEGVTARNAKKTHCSNGHRLSGDNVAMLTGARKGRECRTCTRERVTAIRARKRAALAAVREEA